ncbi:MAG: sensor histidine kinase [Lachnospiraceae bacterium]
MIKKLRKKLVITAMLSLLLVLIVIEGIVGFLNYYKIATDADRVLEILEQNDGKFPKMDLFEPEKEMTEQPENDRTANSEEKKPFDKKNEMSAEMPYESRFFSVLLKRDGTVMTTDTGKIASVDTSTAMEYAKRVWESGKEKGFMEEYRYLVKEAGDDEVRIIFLNRKRELSNFNNLLITGLEVTTLGLVAVFVLMVFLSSYITRPFLENYEKQRRFITDAGHELKTPLAIIDADVEVLAMDIGESNEWLNDIKAQSKRLAGLTNDLIMLSRMEEGRQEYVMVDLPFSDLVEETANTYQTLAKTQNKTLLVNITPMVSVHGDEKSLIRLVSILLDNAVKYTPDEGKIVIALEKEKKWVKLTVNNTAEYIDREQLGHLFDRFYRTDDSRNSQTGGYGLGLSIAAATVEAHKGKISADMENERTLCIMVKLPIVLI